MNDISLMKELLPSKLLDKFKYYLSQRYIRFYHCLYGIGNVAKYALFFFQISSYNQFIKLFIYNLLLPFTFHGINDLSINLTSSVKKKKDIYA